MANERTHTEKTAADTKAAGFDYQYYFYLWKLLSMRKGQSVGYEVKDDVHTELNNDQQILYQLKHTVQTRSDGSPKNFTTSDIDLWKTLSNWVQVLTDAKDGRGEIHSQLRFLEKTSFVLASNKSSNSKNEIVKALNSFQNGTQKIDEVRSALSNVLGNSTDMELKGYIKVILELKDKILAPFLSRIFFHLDEDDIIKKCKDALLSDKIEKGKINNLFSNLDSSIKLDNFINIKNGKKVNVTFDEYYQRYRRYYTLSRDASLSITDITDIGITNEKLEEQIFIKQLIDINECNADDLEDITEFTLFKLKLRNNLENWLHEGEITSEEIDRFKKDCILQWKTKHKSAFRDARSDEEFNRAALSILDAMRDRELSIAGQTLGTDMSHGTFYSLSDIPKIGWQKNWEKYKA